MKINKYQEKKTLYTKRIKYRLWYAKKSQQIYFKRQ